ncbi:MAG: chorismate mutase [Methanomicrobiaceae archaeon]|nr:chorismate mutase [Methanomicrobiaceae archaeon]
MTLEEVRARMAEVDQKIIALITERQNISTEIARIKHREGLPVHDDVQVKRVLERAFTLAVENNVNPVLVQQVFEVLVKMNEERQHEFFGEGNLP